MTQFAIAYVYISLRSCLPTTADVAQPPRVLKANQEVILLRSIESESHDVTTTRLVRESNVQRDASQLLAQYSGPGLDFAHPSADPVFIDPLDDLLRTT